MGYTHYWKRRIVIQQPEFQAIAHDFQKLLPSFRKFGIPLAGVDGTGEPVVAPLKEVSFNGARNCGHPPNHELVLPWPAPNAGGVYAVERPISGRWYAGAVVETRTCDGDCSYEGFYFPRVYIPADWEEPDERGMYFNFCKTAFRPYDLAVTAFLLIAKHYLGDDIVVSTDGEDAHWRDAKILCLMELGYGADYRIVDGYLVKGGKR